jgi:hypothetical protein
MPIARLLTIKRPLPRPWHRRRSRTASWRKTASGCVNAGAHGLLSSRTRYAGPSLPSQKLPEVAAQANPQNCLRTRELPLFQNSFATPFQRRTTPHIARLPLYARRMLLSWPPTSMISDSAIVESSMTFRNPRYGLKRSVEICDSSRSAGHGTV